MQNLFGGYNPYPYIYIQYSHDDAETVIPIIKALKSKNYNVVFDKNFREEDKHRYLNVQQFTQAAAFLLFYSKSAAKSRLIKECVRFAVPMYNLEKVCVCLDDTKFGFSFSDLKKNYTLIEETKSDEILEELFSLLDVFIIPGSAKNFMKSVRRKNFMKSVGQKRRTMRKCRTIRRWNCPILSWIQTRRKSPIKTGIEALIKMFRRIFPRLFRILRCRTTMRKPTEHLMFTYFPKSPDRL